MKKKLEVDYNKRKILKDFFGEELFFCFKCGGEAKRIYIEERQIVNDTIEMFYCEKCGFFGVDTGQEIDEFCNSGEFKDYLENAT